MFVENSQISIKEGVGGPDKGRANKGGGGAIGGRGGRGGGGRGGGIG